MAPKVSGKAAKKASKAQKKPSDEQDPGCEICGKAIDDRRDISVWCHKGGLYVHRKCTTLKHQREWDQSFECNKCSWCKPGYIPPMGPPEGRMGGCIKGVAELDVQLAPAQLFRRYVDDIIRSIKETEIERLLEVSNRLHRNLEFTIEREVNNSIAFLDLYITRDNRKVTTSWYNKPTDTGVQLNYHACAPTKYKRNIVEGSVHRIHHTTSTWEAFNDGIEKLKKLLESNQYPPTFYQPIIRDTITKIVAPSPQTTNTAEETRQGRNVFITQYRGRISDELSKKIRKVVKVSVIFTTRKLKTCLPSLKAPVPMELKSCVVYQITCSGCNSCYVGQTARHLRTRLSEHRRPTAPVGGHLAECAGRDNFQLKILGGSCNLVKLLTLEALFISRLKPDLNSREEYRQRPLTIRL